MTAGGTSAKVLGMKVLRLLPLLVALSACVDPRLNAGVSIGPGGTRVYPSISTGIEGGGTITYSP